MPLLKGCQPRLGWVMAVLCSVPMEELTDGRMAVKMSSAGTCRGVGSVHTQGLACWVWIVTPQISPYVCKGLQKAEVGLDVD